MTSIIGFFIKKNRLDYSKQYKNDRLPICNSAYKGIKTHFIIASVASPGSPSNPTIVAVIRFIGI